MSKVFVKSALKYFLSVGEDSTVLALDSLVFSKALSIVNPCEASFLSDDLTLVFFVFLCLAIFYSKIN